MNRQLSDVFSQSVNISYFFSVQSKWRVSRLYLQAAFLPLIDRRNDEGLKP